MKRLIPILFIILLAFPSTIASGQGITTSSTSISNLVPFTTAQIQSISTPTSGCFFGQTANQNTTQVNYTFKPNGVVYWSNSDGSNITISSVSVGGSPIQITQGLMNSTTFAYPLSSLSLTGNLYLSQLQNGCGTQSNEFSLKISGTVLSPTTFTLNIGNPKFLQVKCDSNNLRYFVGTEGIQFRDAISYTPFCALGSITFNLPAGAFNIDPTTIGTSNSNGNCAGTGCDNQLRLWQSNGYFWEFYTDNVHFGYRSCLISSGNCGTSSANWGSFTSINTNAAIGDCSTNMNVTISSTYLYYACATSSNSFIFDAGHLGAGGTFTLSRPQITVTTTNSQSGYAFVYAISNSSVWVAVKTYDGTNEHIEVWSANFQGVGAFSKQLDQNDNFGNNDAHPSLDAVRTGGNTYIEVTWGYDGYSINAPLRIRWSTNYGSTWAAAVATACNIDAMGYSQVRNTNGTEYIVGTQAGGSGCTQGKLDYIRWDYGSASITYETKNFLTTCSNNCDGNTIFTDGGSHYGIIYESSTTTIQYVLSTNSGNTYGVASTLSSAETLSSIDFTLSNSYTCDPTNGELVSWMSGSGTPFNVRFATSAGCAPAGIGQPIKITTANSGPAGTFTISGCSATPTTISSDGSVHTITVTNSCTLTITTPADGLHSRYRFSDRGTPVTTWSFTTSTTEQDNTTYYQLAENWTLTAQSPTTWDGGYFTNIIGTFLGTASTSTACSLTSAGTTNSHCVNIYFDYNTQSCSSNPIGNTWNAVAPNCFTDTTADNVHTVNYIQSSGGNNSLIVIGGLLGIGSVFIISRRRRAGESDGGS